MNSSIHYSVLNVAGVCVCVCVCARVCVRADRTNWEMNNPG